MKALLVLLLLLTISTLSHAQSKPKWVRTNHPGLTSALSFSSDGKYLASTSENWNEIILWGGSNGEFIRRMFPAQPRRIGGAEFMTNSRSIALGGDSGIYLYDVESGALVGERAGYETTDLVSLDVTSTGDTIGWLASRGERTRPTYYFYDRRSKSIFDSISMYNRGTFGSQGFIYLSSLDLRTIVYRTANDQITIRTTSIDSTFPDDGLLKYHQPSYLSPRGDYLLLSNYRSNKVDSLHLPSLTLTEGVDTLAQENIERFVTAFSVVNGISAFADNRNWQTPEYGVSDGYILFVKGDDTTNITALTGGIALSPIEDKIVAGGSNGMATYDYNGEITSLDKTYNGQGVTGLSYSSAGEFSYISIGDMSREYTHDIVIGKKSYTHHMAGAGFNCFNTPRIDPAANRFAMGLEILSRDTGWFAMQCPVVTSEWTPSGSHYVWSQFNDSLVLQDRSNAHLFVSSGHGRIFCIAASRNLIATGGKDSTIRLWSHDGALVNTIRGHTGSVYSVAFSPSEDQLVSSATDSTIRVWNLAGDEIFKYDGLPEYFGQVAVTNDGLSIIAASNRSIIAYDASGWANVKDQPVAQRHQLTAQRIENGIRLLHNLQSARVLVEVYDLLGRLLYRANHGSYDGGLVVPFDATSAQPLILQLTDGSDTAATLVR